MLMLRCRELLFFILVCLSVALSATDAASQRSALVIQGGTLIDGTGSPPLENAVILVEGERIKAIGKRGEVIVPRGARVIDVKGKTLLPGFIDGHCHLLDFMGEIYLHLGITTCPDITQNDDEWTLAQRNGTNAGKIRGPRIWSTGGRLVGPPPAWALRGERGYLVKTPDEARAVVRKKKEMGIEIIKFNEYVEPEVIKAGAEEANKLGMPITCHCLDVFLAAENNFAGVEHHWGMGMTTIGDLKKRGEVHEQRMTGKINTADLAYFYESENFDKVVKAAVEKNISWSPTIATWYRPLSPSVARFKERELSILDKKTAGYLPGVLREQALGQYERYAKFPPERLARAREGYKKLEDLMRRYVQAGGLIRAGSDPNNGLPGLGVHQEMVMFVEAGLTPMQAIQAGTINVAKAFRKDKDFGTVEAGKVADIIAIEGDPLKDIWAVQNVKLVVLGGKIIDQEFHANYKNPIPAIRAWRATPQEIEISPRSLAQGSSGVMKISARRGFDRFHKATLNGKILETRFISPGELEASIPANMTKDVGTYPVVVVGQGDFASKSAPTYFIVSFKQ
ncbi:MAG TPA: amidohydrolase family protein [Candidatus Binatia bacterium]|nr:amidohydrolase family protein [Candidatus Binatia bacterium]